MKKFFLFRSSAALLILSLLLSGCTTILPVLSPDTTEELTDPVTEEPVISGNAEKLADNLWKYTFSDPVDTVKVGTDGTILTVQSLGHDFRLTLTDIFTGETSSGTYSPAGQQDFVFLQPELFCGLPIVFEVGSGVLASLNEDFSVNDSAVFDADTSAFYRTSESDAIVISCDPPAYTPIVMGNGMTHREETAIRLRGSEMLNYAACFPDKDSAILSVFDPDTGEAKYVLYDRRNGTEEDLGGIPADDVIYGMCGDILIMGDYTKPELRLYNTKEPGLISTAVLPDDSSVVITDVGSRYVYYYRSADDGLRIGRLSPETGTFSKEITVDEHGKRSFVSSCTECGDHTVVIVSGEEGYYALIWKPEETETPQEGFSGLIGKKTGTDENTCRSLAENLMLNHGVSFALGNDAVRYFDDYAVVPTDDWERTYEVLDLLSDFFSKLPDGMMNEVARCFDGIEICIVGSILPDTLNRDSIGDAVGFTVCRADIEYCVLNLSMSLDDLSATVPHEFFHIFEQAMVRMGRETDIFTDWNDYNPRTFLYSYVYTAEDGSTIKTADPELLGTSYEDGISDPGSVYFVDGYSTTYPKEDRARIFETLFLYADDLPAYFKGEHIRAKAEYLCQCLREAFYPVSVCDEVIWEKGLKQYAE